jgi:hypothetical protein
MGVGYLNASVAPPRLIRGVTGKSGLITNLLWLLLRDHSAFFWPEPEPEPALQLPEGALEPADDLLALVC